MKIKIALENETVTKLEKLSAQSGKTTDEIINESLQELLHETESTDS